MDKHLSLLLILSLFYGTLGLRKNLQVELDGASHNIYLDGEQWFRSSDVLRVRHLGNTWSTEKLNVFGRANEYLLKTKDSKGTQLSGSDSIGVYTGVK